jgi:hypothetical protein
MSQSDPPIQDFSQLINVTVLIEKDGNPSNPTVNLRNLYRPLRFDAIVEQLIQLGKCARKIDGIRL